MQLLRQTEYKSDYIFTFGPCVFLYGYSIPWCFFMYNNEKAETYINGPETCKIANRKYSNVFIVAQNHLGWKEALEII